MAASKVDTPGAPAHHRSRKCARLYRAGHDDQWAAALPAFPGWVAVLQSSSQPHGDQVQLQVHSFAGLSGTNTALEYVVAVCGDHPYKGVLLIGGDAQLIDASPGQTGAGPEEIVYPWDSFHNLAHLVVTATTSAYPGSASGTEEDIGPVQVGRFTISRPWPCPAHMDSHFPANAIVTIGGFALAPIEQRWTAPFGWWHGPHISQTWPLAGTLGAFYHSPGDSWSPYKVKGLPGTWREPTPDYVQVSPAPAYGVPINWSIDAAQPAVSPMNTGQSDTSPVNWSSTSAIDPIARLTDISSLTALQDWLIVAGVGMGIGGAMLASLAFEKLAPHHTAAAAVGEHGSPISSTANPPQSRDHEVTRSRRSRHRLIVIVAAIIISLAKHHQARRRPTPGSKSAS